MTVVPASHLSASELRTLGNNVLPTVVHDRLGVDTANRRLGMRNKSFEWLYRRAGRERRKRVRCCR